MTNPADVWHTHGLEPWANDPAALAACEARADDLYREHLREVHRRRDRVFAVVMAVQWVFGLGLAFLGGAEGWRLFDLRFDPTLADELAWGTIVSGVALIATICFPGRTPTRHLVAVCQMAWSVLIIHMLHGRPEAHFHVFGGLVLLAYYRDPRVLASATLVVAGDHLFQGLLWPESVSGVLDPSWFRSLQHAVWLLFADVALVLGILERHREMRALARRQAESEAANATVERKVQRRTEELEASREQYRNLVESTHTVPWQMEADTGWFTYVGPQAAELLGCAPGDWLVPWFWQERVHRDDRTAVEEAYRDAIAGGRHVAIEFRMRHESGDWIWVRSVASPSGERDARVLHGVFIDMTERRRAQERLEHVVASSTAVIYQLRIAGEASALEWMSDNVARVLGYEVDEALEPGWWFRNVHPDDRDRLAKEPDHLAKDATREYRLKNKEGAYRWVRDDQRVLLNAEGQPAQVVGAFTDVTEKRHLEAELQHAQKLESVGRLASGIAHEINTPVQFVADSVVFALQSFDELAPMRGRYAEALRDAAERDPAAARALQEIENAEAEVDVAYLCEQVPRALERSLEGLERVALIVGSMREFASTDQREMVEADLNRALSTTLTVARNEYKYVAEVEADFGELPPVRCHVNELNQVFLNILVNAAHAIADRPDGRGERGRIAITTRAEGAWVHLSIADDGCGIPESARASVFDPFFTTKEPGRGTGQGLAIARGVVVDRHHGRLSFESVEGEGTTFHIRLPVAGRQARASEVAA